MTRWLAAVAAIVFVGAGEWRQTPLRFHHIHYSVADPGAQLRPASDALEGIRTIVPGVGVGVRVEREYLMFARAMDGMASSRRRQNADDLYADAVRWLSRRGFAVQPAALRDTLVARSLPREPIDHIAFAADDLSRALAAIGVAPASANDVSATFRLPSGAIVEIVQDTDRPDNHWCPMHPGVRAPVTGTCPICGMPLVPIPPPRSGEYRLDAELRARGDGGASHVRLTVRDPEDDAVVSRFVDVHERAFHLFVISRDLSQFAHLHPSQTADGSFALDHDLAPGMYLLIADFLPAGGTSQLVHRMVTTPGYAGPLFGAAPAIEPGPLEQTVGGLRIRMTAEPPSPRRPAPIRFEIADAARGTPVTDLEPFLGAAGHLLIVDENLTTAIHGHPEETGTAGSSVTFAPVLPASGRYKLWVQFQRRGDVITAPFVIDARSEIR